MVAEPDRLREPDITQSPPIRPRQSYRHEAFLWRDPSDFVAGLEPFVREGVEAGEPVMVATIDEHSGWLRDALGADAAQVRFVDMSDLGRNPACIIPGWQHFLNACSGGGRPVRGIGEPIWAGRRPEEVHECQLHEALLNVAVDPGTPFWLVCPYDTSGLEASVIDEAHRSHPVIVESESYRGSADYAGRAHVDSMFAAELPAIGETAAEVSFTADTLSRVFAAIALRGYAAGVPAGKAADLAAAAHQLAESSVRRGAENGVIRIWQLPDAFVCEVSDDTALADPLAGRRAPAGGEVDGLWFANQLCDLVQLRSAASGTTVRVHTWT